MKDSDLIRRSDAISAAKTGADDWDGGCNKERDRYIDTAFADIPAVDAVEVRHGRWIDRDGNDVTLDEYGCPEQSAWCSECHDWLSASDEYSVRGRFCPNCGAKMDGRREDGLYQSLKRGLEEAIAYEKGEVELRTERREDGDA